MKPHLIVIYLAAAGEGLSGGTRIHIECTKRWISQKLFSSVTVFASDSGYITCINHGIPRNNVNRISTRWSQKINFWLDYLVRIMYGFVFAFRHNLDKSQKYYVYAASDFWADFFPAFIFKIRFRRNVTLITPFYLTAPSPWSRDNPYKGIYLLKGFLYWLSQLPVYFFIKNFSDFICVTSQPDVRKFITNKRDASKIIIVQGGVDITNSQRYLKSGRITPINKREYDACFMGRFHHQKGVSELIDIWRLVVNKKKNAKLAMIGKGTGSLDFEVMEKIKSYKLEKNIDVYGFLEGEKKYAIFKNSKIVVHPATYDSGGMASAEAMAWGLPGVSFDLESLKTYYPKGMLKTTKYDIKSFSHNILKLITDKALYRKKSAEALKLITDIWDWNKRADIVAQKLFK